MDGYSRHDGDRLSLIRSHLFLAFISQSKRNRQCDERHISPLRANCLQTMSIGCKCPADSRPLSVT
jgi:hypothetical protein